MPKILAKLQPASLHLLSGTNTDRYFALQVSQVFPTLHFTYEFDLANLAVPVSHTALLSLVAHIAITSANSSD